MWTNFTSNLSFCLLVSKVLKNVIFLYRTISKEYLPSVFVKFLHNSAMIVQTYTEYDCTIIYSEMYTVHCRTLISDLFTFQFLWLFEVCHYLQIRLIHTQLDLQPSKDFEGKYHKISNNLRVGYLSLRFWILDGQQIHSSLLYKSWLV